MFFIDSATGTTGAVSYFSLAGAIIIPFDADEVSEDPARMWGVMGGSAAGNTYSGLNIYTCQDASHGYKSAPQYGYPTDDGYSSFLY